MAITKITPIKIEGMNEFSSALVFTEPTAVTDGFAIDYTGKDDRIVLLVQNSDNANEYDITVKMGTGIQGVADIIKSIPAGETVSAVLESGAFKQILGTDTHKDNVIVIPENAAIKIAAIELP